MNKIFKNIATQSFGQLETIQTVQLSAAQIIEVTAQLIADADTHPYVIWHVSNKVYAQWNGVMFIPMKLGVRGTIYATNVVTTSIATVNTPVKVVNATTTKNMVGLDDDGGTSNRLKNISGAPIIITATASISMQGVSNNIVFSYYFAVNGVIDQSTRVQRKIGTGSDIGALAIIGSIVVPDGDYVELWVENNTDNSDVIVNYFNLTIN